jgi:hypothetical protein
MEDFNLAKRAVNLSNSPRSQQVLQDVKQRCYKQTIDATLAKKELDRLDARRLEKLAQVKAYQVQQGRADVFPEVPVDQPIESFAFPDVPTAPPIDF